MGVPGKATRKPRATLDPLPPDYALRMVEHARRRYAAMGTYDPDKADRIAAGLFLSLLRPWMGNPTMLGRACGISPVALWKWRTRRSPVHIDTVARACDRLARQLILPSMLAEEAANLMSGVPWSGKKTGSQLLHYAVAQGLSARALFQLARRQERLNALQYAHRLGIGIGLLNRMSLRPGCDKPYAAWRGNYRLGVIARRFGLEDPDDIAEFRLLVRNGAACRARPRHDLARAFRGGAAAEPRSRFLRRFFSLLKERRGLKGNLELAKAVLQELRPSDEPAGEETVRLKRRLISLTKPVQGCVRLLPAWARGMATLAFPGKTEADVRGALFRYLVFHPEE